MFYFMVKFEIVNYAVDSTQFSAKLDAGSVVWKFHLRFYSPG